MNQLSYTKFKTELSGKPMNKEEKKKAQTEAGIIKCPKEITIVCQSCGYRNTHQFASTQKAEWHKELELTGCPQCGGK